MMVPGPPRGALFPSAGGKTKTDPEGGLKASFHNCNWNENESRKEDNPKDVIAKADDEGVEWSEENQTGEGPTKG